MRPYHKLITFSLASLLALSTTACGDDAGGAIDVETEEPGDEPNDEPGDEPSDEPGDDVPVEPEDVWEAILIPSMATDVELPNKGFQKLGVSLVSTQGDMAGEGLVGESIKWGVETGTESVYFSVKKSDTGENGNAWATLYATEVSGEAVVVVSSDLAPKPVKFNVRVLDVPTGNLNAKTHYNGKAPVENYSIRLYDGKQVQCAGIDLENGVITDYRTGEEVTPLLDPVDASTALFENLSLEQRYAVVAYGYAANGAPVAAGCIDSGTDVYASQTTDVTVYLDTIDLDPVTTYHVRSYFDLGDIVSSLGSVGKTINTMTDVAANPGSALYGFVYDIIADATISLIAQVLDWLVNEFGFKTQFINYINNMVTKSNALNQIGFFACQLGNIVHSMELMGDLDMQKEGDVELSGNSAYNGLAVYWRSGCSGSTDPNCGRYALSARELNDAVGTNVDLLEGSWNGSLANGYDKLAIETHDLSFHYGRIVVALILNVLLPKVSNGNTTIEGAFSYWINCNSVGDWLHNVLADADDTFFGVISNDWYATSNTRGWCRSAVSGLVGLLNFASSFATLKKANSNIRLSGTAMLEDSNGDNFVDIIHKGVWDGSMTVTSTETSEDGASVAVTTTSAVRGVWSAYNSNNVETGEGMYCTLPKTSTDSAEQLCSYPLIDVTGLVNKGLCDKYAAAIK